ncbi:oligosaccharide flippase family protein [Parabacteroides sp. APC149_11_2_Y6]
MSKITDLSNSKQVLWLVLGSIISFCFAIFSTAILSRYFTKDDYGTYRQVIFIYTTLLEIFTFGLPKAFSYFLARISVENGRGVSNRLNFCLILIGGAFSVTLLVSSSLIAQLLNNPSLSYALKLFSPVPLFMLPTMGLDGICATYRNTRKLAVYTIFSRVVMFVCIVFPVILFGANYLVSIIGYSISSVLMFILAMYMKNSFYVGFVSTHCIVSYREIFNYVLPILGGSLFSIIFSFLSNFFVSRYFGTQAFAVYANGTLDIPFVTILTTSITAVLVPLFANYSSINARKEMLLLWNKSVSKIIILTYPVVLFCVVFANDIIVVLYGEKYLGSAVFFQINSLSNLFTIVNFSPLIFAIGKVKQYMLVQAISVILLIPLQYIMAEYFHSLCLILLSYIFVRIIIIIMYIYIMSDFLNVRFFNLIPWKIILNILSVVAFILLIIRALLNIDNHIADLFVGGGVFIISYFLWLKIIKKDKMYVSIIKSIIN